jgi:hypothetical protein
MRPGQTDVNEFELAILSTLAEEKPSLRQLMPELRVLSREFTGVGSYTTFMCSASAPDLGDEHISIGKLILMPSVPNGMGATLFCEAGKPHILETYTHGAELWDGVYTGFSFGQSA